MGLVTLAGGAAVLTGVATGPDSLVLVGSGLVGLGLGSSVAPALFTTGFSLRAGQLQRVFASEPAWDSPPLAAGIRRRALAPSHAGNGHPSSHEAARVEALARAVARGES